MKKFLIIISFMCIGMMLPAVAQNLTFHHLTTDEGLSQPSVMTLYRDETGFIWAGTREGLNRYDGHKFHIYKTEKNNPYSISGNNILHIDGNQNGKIYILTNDGLEMYNMETDRFSILWDDANIKSIHYHNVLYVAKGHEVYIYNEETSKLNLYYQLPDPDITISTLYQTPENTLYIGTEENGLFTLRAGKMLEQPISEESNITSIYQDSAGDMWMGTWEHGLFIISKDKRVRNFTYQGNGPPGISSNFVRTCCEDSQGNMWIGTLDGLNKYDKKSGKFSLYTENSDPDGLTNSSIWCIIKDHQGTLWMGTYFGGINYFNPEYEIYTWYKKSNLEKDGLSSSIVGQMTEDKHKNLWICTEGGLNVYHPTTKTFRWYRKQEGENSLSSNSIKSIYYDKERDVIWLGTINGLNRLDPHTNKFTHYRNSQRSTGNFYADFIRDIEPYGKQLILATADGVYLFDPDEGKSRTLFPKSNRRLAMKDVYDVCADHKNTLWISVYGEGVYKYDFATKRLRNYRNDPADPHSLSNNNVNSITLDSSHNLYFCTSGGGLDVYRYESRDFENFDSQHNGLAGDCVYSICESSPGELFVTSNQGFSIFYTKTKRFYNYGKQNGFPLSAINEKAIYLTQEQEVFLGGMQGLVSFDKEALSFTRKPYFIAFTRLFVNGKEITANDATDILHTSLAKTPNITLNHKESNMTVEFALTNYIAANQEDIVYQLEGYSDEWTPVRDLHNITYTNLNPGTYTLRVKCADPNNRLVNEARLHIRVLPSIYRTQTAYVLYIILFLGISFFLIQLYMQRMRLRASLVYEQRHRQDVEELNQAKLHFFTHVSHEFRTPLSLIIGQLETLLELQLFTPAVFTKLSRMYNSSLQLRDLITELLDFRKQEQGYMNIFVSEHNIVDFLYSNYLLFQEYADNRNICFTFEKEEDTIPVWYDERQMQKVMNNLLSNAFKCTHPDDSITIRVHREDGQVIIEVADTGIGIPEEYIGRLFERFFQIERPDATESGAGIGLPLSQGIIRLHHGEISVESVVNQGSVFRIVLPLGDAHFTEEQRKPQPDAMEMEIEKATTDIKVDGIGRIVPLIEQGIRAEVRSNESSPDEDNPDTKARIAKVLVVEDNMRLRQMLAEILGDFYLVITAADGREGWEKVKDEMPNLVISDIAMPYMSGTELCKAIKGEIDTCHIPVMLLTAKAAIKYNLEGLKVGADDYVTKPFNVALLISRCNNLINSRIMLKEIFSRQPQTSPQVLATNALDKAFLDKSMEIVEHNMENPEFSVNEFAAGMSMSRTKLFSKLKAVTGQSPNEYISTIRLKKAALLLRNNPELSIVDISTMVGFSSPRYFSKCFKDTYHIRPLDYRKEGAAYFNN